MGASNMSRDFVTHNPSNARWCQFLSGCLLPHHPGDAAWLPHRAGDVVLQITNCRRADIAGPYIGPSAATLLAFAGGLARLPARIGRYVELPVVAAEPVDAVFDRSDARLDDPGPAYPRYATGRHDARHHPGLEP